MCSEALQRLSVALPSTARLQRLGMSAAASLQLLQVVDDLLLLTRDPILEARIEPALKELLGALERGDVLCAADHLEYVLLPALHPTA